MTIGTSRGQGDDTSKEQLAAKDDSVRPLGFSQADQKADHSKAAELTSGQRIEALPMPASSMEEFLTRAQVKASLGLQAQLQRRGIDSRQIEVRLRSIQSPLDDITGDLGVQWSSAHALMPEGGIKAWLARAREREQPREPSAAPEPLRQSSTLAELLTGAGQTPDAEALRLQTISDLREVAAAPAEAYRYIESRLPDRLVALERDGSLSRDRLADVAIAALQVVPAEIRVLFGSLVPRIRGYLEGEAEERRDNDWLTSIGALGDAVPPGEVILAGDQPPLPGYLLDAIYYNWLVAFILCRRQDTSELSRGEQILLGNNLNNLVVSSQQIIERYESAPDHDPGRARAARGRQQKLLAAGAGFRDELAQNLPAAVVEASLAPFGWATGRVPRGSERAFLASFGQMVVLSDVPQSSPARPIFRAMAGVVRAAEANASQTAAAFFNAGVALLRLGTEAAIDMPAARAMLNGLGLCWALELNHDVFSALGPNDGFDCAVNLFGALAAMGDDAHRHAQPAEAIFQALLQLSESRPGLLNPTDLTRIRTSGQRLGLRQAMLTDAEQELRMGARKLLSSLAASASIDEPWPEQPERRPGWTAETAAAALRLAFGAEYEEGARVAETAVLEFLRQKLEPEVTLRDVYRGHLPDGGLAGAKRGAAINEAVFDHPIVAVLGQTDLPREYQRATEMSIERCDSLAGAVRGALDLARELVQLRSASASA